MDLLRFIRSEDIRVHLEKIGYKFTSLEAAWLIYQCKDVDVTIKHQAWNELIQTMPDCEIEDCDGIIASKTLHEYLKKYMDYEDRFIEDFFDPEKNCFDSPNKSVFIVYLSALPDDVPSSYDELPNDGIYSSLDALRNAFNPVGYRFIKRIYCLKVVLDDPYKISSMLLDGDLETVYEIDPFAESLYWEEELDYQYFFKGIRFTAPVPFVPGDILCLPNGKVFLQKDDPNAVDRNESDVEMYTINDARGIHGANFTDYDIDLEYCHDELSEEYEALIPVSDYLKGKIDKYTCLERYKTARNKAHEAEESNCNHIYEFLDIPDPQREEDYTKEYCDAPNDNPEDSIVQRNETAIRIWLDDVRDAPEGYHGCHSVNKAKELIEKCEFDHSKIEVIDCDHDLGDYSEDGGDGIKLLEWLAERGTFYPIELHTMNPVGRENMQQILDRYWK